uniref:Reverse transcriptase domain-containing protein n=1 Tax=Tanacetum cinerariifolium TaxID=118510 RepID=A0A699GGY1_TANCI|nr:hypothetical protein [Tanacetum cinerariifolium]
MILRDGDERLTLNMRHDTSSYSNKPQRESINMFNIFNDSSDDFLEDLFSNQPSGNPTFSSHPELTSSKVKHDIFDSEGGNVLPEKLLDLDSTKDLHPPLHFDVESYIKEIEFLLYQDTGSSLKDSIDQSHADIFIDSMPEMFTDQHALDYSSPPIFDEYDDDFLEVESDTENVYDDPFDSKGEKIKESKLLIDELDLPCDLLPSEYDSFISQDFSRVDALRGQAVVGMQSLVVIELFFFGALFFSFGADVTAFFYPIVLFPLLLPTLGGSMLVDKNTIILDSVDKRAMSPGNRVVL